jgi:hypothetical protein
MTFDYEEKPSTSRFVDVFWQTFDRSNGTYLAAADACWDMIFIRGGDGIRALLSGPSSNITPVPYKAGNRNVGIRFVRGSFLTHVPATVMVDTTVVLPMADEGSFVLAGETWAVPTYEAVEDFVASWSVASSSATTRWSWPCSTATRPTRRRDRSSGTWRRPRASRRAGSEDRRARTAAGMLSGRVDPRRDHDSAMPTRRT